MNSKTKRHVGRNINEDEDDDPWSAADTDDEEDASNNIRTKEESNSRNAPQNTSKNSNNNVLINRFQKWRQTTNPLVKASRSAIQGVVENINNNTGIKKHSPSEQEEEEVNYISEENDNDIESSNSSSLNSSISSHSMEGHESTSTNHRENDSNFRGRYEHDSPKGKNNRGKQLLDSIINKKKKNAAMDEEETQTNKILRSSSGSYLQSIMDALDEGQYVMLLGNGMLGVNLKQDYLQSGGVYVDYIVPDGNAARSGVILVGDQILKVGDTDVSKGTIYDVPQIIASSSRPCTIILQHGHYAEAASSSYNYCTMAHAKINRIVQETQKNKSLEFDFLDTPTLRNTSSLIDTEVEGKNEAETNSNQIANNDTHNYAQPNNIEMTTDGILDNDAFHETLCPYDESNDKANVVYNRKLPSPSKNSPLSSISVTLGKHPLSSSLFSAISYSINNDTSFRNILREALICCCIDSRRLSYLESFFDYQDEQYNPVLSAKSQLKLYLDLLSFRDLFDILPNNMRQKQYLDIAYKYILPRMNENGGTQAPPMDVHSLLPPETLTALAIQCHSSTYDSQQDELLWEVEQLVEASLLSGSMFISFLLSNFYTRMRAQMKNTRCFVDPPLSTLRTELITNADEQSCAFAHNHFLFMIIFLLLNQQLTKGEEEQSSGPEDKPNDCVLGNAGGICCMIYIQKHVLNYIPNIEECDENAFTSLIRVLEQLWEIFLAPGGGLLDSSLLTTMTQETLNHLRRLLVKALSPPSSIGEPHDFVMKELLDGNLKNSLIRLSEDLYSDYATQLHPNYRQHTIHEFMCDEVHSYRQTEKEQEGKDESTEETNEDESSIMSESDEGLPPLPSGSVKKLLRKIDLPSSISRHCPLRSPAVDVGSLDIDQKETMDCAIVFGLDDGMDSTGRLPTLSVEEEMQPNDSIRRFSSISLVDGSTSNLNIPSTLENFAVVPSLRERVFSTSLDESRISQDGWEVSLINFMMPDNNNNNIYGVSLVLHQSSIQSQKSPTYQTKIISKDDLPYDITTKLTEKREVVFYSEENYGDSDEDTEKVMKRYVCLSEKIPKFNEKLQNMRLSDSMDSRQSSYGDDHNGITIGIALTSQQNTIPSMRMTLSKLYEEFSKPVSFHDDDHDSQRICAPLVDFLGTFSLKNVEESSLKCLLDPFSTMTNSLWIDRPLSDQKEAFELAAGQALIESLPPLSFALTFITCLLEQKIVISSCRRSVLLSIATAMRNLLQPLDWSHLFVPLVPTMEVANDLLQYPAPFILGIPSEDEGSLELLNSLPEDVTFVDLDAGRVILARTLSGNFDNFKSSNDHPYNAATMVRSQVLCLAEALGSVIGAGIHGPSWKSDSPLQVLPLPSSFLFPSAKETENAIDTMEEKFLVARRICHDFIQELLVGVKSCCYWIEEKFSSLDSDRDEAIVMFDEGRFLRIKDLRSQGVYLPLLLDNTSFISPDSKFPSKADLALSVEGFDLLLETFLRGQSMSTYISSRQKKEMVFW